MFVFLTAAARTRIVTADLMRFYNCTGLLLLHVQFLTFLLCKDCIPLKLGLGIEQVNLVGIHGNHDLVAAARLGGGSHTSHQVLALVGQVQVDLSAHQLGDFDLSGDVAVGMLLEEFLVVLDVLRTDADAEKPHCVRSSCETASSPVTRLLANTAAP